MCCLGMCEPWESYDTLRTHSSAGTAPAGGDGEAVRRLDDQVEQRAGAPVHARRQRAPQVQLRRQRGAPPPHQQRALQAALHSGRASRLHPASAWQHRQGTGPRTSGSLLSLHEQPPMGPPTSAALQAMCMLN